MKETMKIISYMVMEYTTILMEQLIWVSGMEVIDMVMVHLFRQMKMSTMENGFRIINTEMEWNLG